jgi:hypothetical protein
MRLSRVGEIAHQYWGDIPTRCANAGLDALDVCCQVHAHNSLM